MDLNHTLANKRILIVDDFMAIRQLIKSLLSRHGFNNFIESDNGVDALEYLNQYEIDLVICDWEMPNMNGIELFSKMRINPDFRNIPFLMITSESVKGRIIEAIDAGITNYVLKPIKTERICKKVIKMLEMDVEEQRDVA